MMNSTRFSSPEAREALYRAILGEPLAHHFVVDRVVVFTKKREYPVFHQWQDSAREGVFKFHREGTNRTRPVHVRGVRIYFKDGSFDDVTMGNDFWLGPNDTVTIRWAIFQKITGRDA